MDPITMAPLSSSIDFTCARGRGSVPVIATFTWFRFRVLRISSIVANSRCVFCCLAACCFVFVVSVHSLIFWGIRNSVGID